MILPRPEMVLQSPTWEIAPEASQNAFEPQNNKPEAEFKTLFFISIQ